MGPLTIMVESMTDTEIGRIVEDAKKANKELHIKDMNGKVTQNLKKFDGGEKTLIDNNSEISELELLSILSSSPEIEQDTKENNLRRPKRPTKTSPIIRLNNPEPFDYRKYRQKAERPRVSNHPGKQPGVRRKPELLNNHHPEWTVQETNTDRTRHHELTRTTAYTAEEL